MSDESVQKPASTQKPFSTPEMVALEAELAVTRAQLASTVDELVARLDPRAQAGRAVASVGHLWSDATSSDAAPDARKKAIALIGGAVAGVAALLALMVAARRKG
ncbi:DUF3618 domain-containing protein [Cellulomonas humilata]|uniref:DUF3618 domain-containing protein n=1 Tax=Cellulomonas humilata TaxID=144055 RepID=A0ABU0EIC9_9CELL|nr:DUF3618 domain-containing protein [Cellulomonas humilata]MDQ0375027.1 hypothetical protein [Cellulomonas humilata]